MKQKFFYKRLKNHPDGRLEILFYDDKMRLQRQRFVDALEFQMYCKQTVEDLNKRIEEEIYDGTFKLLQGPKIILTGGK